MEGEGGGEVGRRGGKGVCETGRVKVGGRAGVRGGDLGRPVVFGVLWCA